MDGSELRVSVRLPVIAAPMLLVSGPSLVIGACKAGIVGSFPTLNARTAEDCERWLRQITDELAAAANPAPYAMNIIVRSVDSDRLEADFALAEQFRCPIVITSVGNPRTAVDRVHAYGGLVFHDVASMRHAEKAIEAGVDGLILLTAGAGGHTGHANAFAFVRAVRSIWNGIILLAGGISDGWGIRAAEVLGADFAYIGTRFAAVQESLASPEYKELLLTQGIDDIVTTDRVTGLHATFMRGSLERAGLDPDKLPPAKGLLKPSLPPSIKPWRDVWSAGHAVGAISDLPTVADLVDQLSRGYALASQQVLRSKTD